MRNYTITSKAFDPENQYFANQARREQIGRQREAVKAARKAEKVAQKTSNARFDIALAAELAQD